MEQGSPKDLMHKFVSYQEQGKYTPYGKMFDIGIATQEAIQRFKNGVVSHQCGGHLEKDNGNGALMRISPLIILLYNEISFCNKIDKIVEFSQITHAHPRSHIASIFLY